MATVIHTGDPQKCKVLTLLECPACGEVYEILSGHYAESATLGDPVSVCVVHGKALTPAEEVKVQDALQRAIDCERGFVQKDGRLIKRSRFLAHVDERKLQ